MLRIRRRGLTPLLGCLTMLMLTASVARTPPAPAAELVLSATLDAPSMSVQGETLCWKATGGETSYEIAISGAPRGAAGRSTEYLSIPRKAGEAQSYTLTLEPGQTAYVGVSADGGLTWSAEEATVVGSVRALGLSVEGQTVRWKPIGAESAYEIAVSGAPRSVAGRGTNYLLVPRQAGETQSYAPTLAPEQTVYVGVSADGGLTWSAEEAVVKAPPLAPPPPPSPSPPPPPPPAPPPTPSPPPPPPPSPAPPPTPPPPTPTAPTLSVSGETITWTAVPGVTRYTLATVLNPTTTRDTTYKTVTGTSYTPPAVPGQVVNYGMSSSVPGEAPWAKEVTIAYPPTPAPPSPTPTPPPPTPTPPPPPPTPAPPTTPTPPPTPIPFGKIIGTNDGAGWGEAPAKTILAGHITWNRVEIGARANTVPRSLSYGFNVLAIAGNVADSAPLDQIDPSQWGAEVASEILANPGVAIAEAGNEMYFKGGVANPVRYGQMYLAAVHAMNAAGIHIPLLFNMWGDYPRGSFSSPSSWSQDAGGGGWLRDAVNGVPGLAAAILANGLSSHPYGALGENYADDGGIAAVPAQESVARAALGSTPPFYITEVGYAISRCGAPEGACSQQDQANKMRAAYQALLADPHVAGIWWYESHDDINGEFGYMNSDNTTRLSFSVLSSIAQEQGQ
jgi:hypothetical protein